MKKIILLLIMIIIFGYSAGAGFKVIDQVLNKEVNKVYCSVYDCVKEGDVTTCTIDCEHYPPFRGILSSPDGVNFIYFVVSDETFFYQAPPGLVFSSKTPEGFHEGLPSEVEYDIGEIGYGYKESYPADIPYQPSFDSSRICSETTVCYSPSSSPAEQYVPPQETATQKGAQPSYSDGISPKKVSRLNIPAPEHSKPLKEYFSEGILFLKETILNNKEFIQEVKDLCGGSCCETDKGILKDNPNILANCYDKDGAHWDTWGIEYGCSGASSITGSAVLNFLVGWAVKDKEKCVEKDSFSAKTGLTKKELKDFGKKHPFIAVKIIRGKKLSIEEKRTTLDYIAGVYEGIMPYASKYLKLYLNPEQMENLPKSEWYGDKGTSREGTLYPVYNIVSDWTEAKGNLDSKIILDTSFRKAKHPAEILKLYESGQEALIINPMTSAYLLPNLGMNAMGYFGIYIQKGENGKAIIRIKDMYDWFASSGTTNWKLDEYITNLANLFGFKNIKIREVNEINIKDTALVDLGQPYIMLGEWEISEKDFLKYDWANKKVEENK